MIVRWADEMIEYLRENYPYHTNKELIEIYKNKFEATLTESKIQNAKLRYNVADKVIPNAGSFKKGDEPWNLGRKMDAKTYEKIKPNLFKKGNITYNTRPVGSRRIGKDGYSEIKIAEPNIWDLEHRVIYREHYGEIPEGYIAIFLDGDKSNMDPKNLKAIPRGDHAVMSRWYGYTNNPDINESKLAVVKVRRKMKEVKKRRNN